MRTRQFMFGLMLSAMVGGGVAIGGYKLLEENNTTGPQADQQNRNVRLSNFLHNSNVVVPEGLNFVAAAELVTPAVVHVMTSYNAHPTSSAQDPMAPFLREFFGDNFHDYSRPRGPQMGFGSGVIVSANGYIVTNNHVIDRADKIEVVMDDKRKFEATLVGKDPNTDLALLKIEGEDLPFVRYGNSDNLRVGEWVLAVGNPMNLTSTVTAGIVSAKGRNINILRTKDNMSIESFIQTDAAVNPGNSGGALVNLNGDLVGINTAIASQTGSYTGYSFAVPATIVSKVVDDLLKYGEVQRALLGVSIREVDAALAKEKDIKDLAGVYVNGTATGSAAAEAGIKEGDVIREINGIPVNTAAQLQEQVARFRPGDKISVKYSRDGKVKTTDATLRNTMGATEIVTRATGKAIELEGATFEPLTTAEMNKLGLDGGAKIKGVKNSKFSQTGIRDGFIITRIDKNEVYTPQDVQKLLNKQSGGVLIEGMYPDGRKAYYAMGW
ncbi:MAG: Do family serine endopeptidase [Hymenobacteraceae bacterium]|nr:Do family serine endopeptidase [Hymenobacteraceae bacterium]MDX5397549.1 Do family serine endopeptidase [Hymenobacteraceae bacterium]MDX5444114.1 Do family serine endopeptidase [Hymenobacteraceae bacterium]MDX5513627.1 Do family serine endopeptidase [Hymenobacteraceae bacterium]